MPSVKSGSGNVDESMITGEPMPVVKSPGDALTGGTINGNGSLTCVVTRTGQDTTLSQIIKMVQQAQNARLPHSGFGRSGDPVVCARCSCDCRADGGEYGSCSGLAPVVSHALVAGVSVLIIACPCAMGLATPTSIMVGTGRAAQLGVLFRQGDALQSLSGVDVVAFDKNRHLDGGTAKPDGVADCHKALTGQRYCPTSQRLRRCPNTRWHGPLLQRRKQRAFRSRWPKILPQSQVRELPHGSGLI